MTTKVASSGDRVATIRLRPPGPKAEASLLSGRRLMIVLAKFLPTRLVLRRREAIALRDAIDQRVEEMPRDGVKDSRET